MHKLEFKYMIDGSKVPVLLRNLAPYLVHDDYSANRPEKCYTVNSIYLDTCQLDFYQEKLAGIKKRKKLRIRGYNERESNSICFLEVKEKNGPVVHKTRTPVCFTDIRKVLTGKSGNTADNGSNADKFFYYMQSLHLLPIVKICYERKAYYYQFNNDIRLNIDNNLRASFSVTPEFLYEEEGMIPSFSGSILEIKTKVGIPTWLNEIVLSLGLRLQPISKYILCLNALSRYERKLNRCIQGINKYYHTHSELERKNA